MNLKAIVQTRWKIEPESVTVYPYGVVYLISIAIAVVWLGFNFLLTTSLTVTEILSIYPLHLIYLTAVVLLWMFARTAIVFDKESKTVYKKLFGLVTTTVIPFNKIDAILPVINSRGSYRYCLYSKDYEQDSGTMISSPFLTESSPHAVEFRAEVLSIIGKYINKRLGNIRS